MKTNIISNQGRAKLIPYKGGKLMQGVKNYGKNVIGGAKIVGGAIKKAAKWPIKQIEKEFRGEDDAIENFRNNYGDRRPNKDRWITW